MCIRDRFKDGHTRDIIPSYITKVVQNEDNTFSGVVWDVEYKWRKKRYSTPKLEHPLIYEAHIGMAQEAERVGTYAEFEQKMCIRDRIKSTKKYGGTCEVAMSYTLSPVHTEDYFVKLAVELQKMGADIICIKDMANLLLPYNCLLYTSRCV